MANAPQYAHQLRYRVQDLNPGETVLEKFSDLAVHETLVTHGFGPDKDPFLRYCIYLSEGSGLHAAIPEWADRKKEALRLAGVNPAHPRYQLVLEMKDEPVQEMRWAWLKAFNSRKFRAYVAGCEAFDQNCQKVEAPIVDNMGSLPKLEIIFYVDGKEKPKEAQERTNETLDQIANIIASTKRDLKADAEQRAYSLRNELFEGLPLQDAMLAKMESELFMGDDELKRLATERAKPRAEGGSIEAKIMNRKQR
jgi:hypothetical protein